MLTLIPSCRLTVIRTCLFDCYQRVRVERGEDADEEFDWEGAKQASDGSRPMHASDVVHGDLGGAKGRRGAGWRPVCVSCALHGFISGQQLSPWAIVVLSDIEAEAAGCFFQLLLSPLTIIFDQGAALTGLLATLYS